MVVAGAGLAAVEPEAALALVNHVRSYAEGHGRGVAVVGPEQRHRPQPVRSGDAQDTAVGTFRHRATDLPAHGLHLRPLAVRRATARHVTCQSKSSSIN